MNLVGPKTDSVLNIPPLYLCIFPQVNVMVLQLFQIMYGYIVVTLVLLAQAAPSTGLTAPRDKHVPEARRSKSQRPQEVRTTG